MKCKNCGSELKIENGNYSCIYCGAEFFKEELLPTAKKQSEFVIKGGVLTSFIGNSETVSIPEGVVSIGKGAFKNNLAVKKVIFAKSVVKIEENAFEACANLREIAGYDNVSYFGNEAFLYSGILKLTIGKNVNFIGKQCFSRMPDLKYVLYTPGKNIKLERAFSYCNSLTEVDTDGNYFFPSFHSFHEVKNNPGNRRPTYADVFVGTPFIKTVKEYLLSMYQEGICPDCGGEIKKGLLHARCRECGIDYKN